MLPFKLILLIYNGNLYAERRAASLLSAMGTNTTFKHYSHETIIELHLFFSFFRENVIHAIGDVRLYVYYVFEIDVQFPFEV